MISTAGTRSRAMAATAGIMGAWPPVAPPSGQRHPRHDGHQPPAARRPVDRPASRPCAAPPIRSSSTSATARAASRRSSCRRGSRACAPDVEVRGPRDRPGARRARRRAAARRARGAHRVRPRRARLVRARRLRGAAPARPAARRHPRDERAAAVRRGRGRRRVGARWPRGSRPAACSSRARATSSAASRRWVAMSAPTAPRRPSHLAAAGGARAPVDRRGAAAEGAHPPQRAGRARARVPVAPRPRVGARRGALGLRAGAALDRDGRRPCARPAGRCAAGARRWRLGEITVPWDEVRRRARPARHRTPPTAAQMRGTAARASSCVMPVADEQVDRERAHRRDAGSGRRATAPGSSSRGVEVRARPRGCVSRATGSSEMSSSERADEVDAPRELAEHVGRDRPRPAVVAEVDDPARDDAQVAGGEVHRRQHARVPVAARRAGGAGTARSARSRARSRATSRQSSTRGLQGARLLEPALGAQPVAAPQRLPEGRRRARHVAEQRRARRAAPPRAGCAG